MTIRSGILPVYLAGQLHGTLEEGCGTIIEAMRQGRWRLDSFQAMLVQ